MKKEEIKRVKDWLNSQHFNPSDVLDMAFKEYVLIYLNGMVEHISVEELVDLLEDEGQAYVKREYFRLRHKILIHLAEHSLVLETLVVRLCKDDIDIEQVDITEYFYTVTMRHAFRFHLDKMKDVVLEG